MWWELSSEGEVPKRPWVRAKVAREHVVGGGEGDPKWANNDGPTLVSRANMSRGASRGFCVHAWCEP